MSYKTAASENGFLETINPCTGEIIESWQEHTSSEIESIISNAQLAFLNWKETPLQKRASALMRLAVLLESRKAELARLMAMEMGKPLSQGVSEVEKCAWVCRYYAENGAEFLKNEIVKTDASLSYICYQPLGIIFAVMPWNFPFWQLFRFAAPAVMAGNAFILKHSPNVTGCALMINTLFKDAGFPSGLPGVLLISEKRVPEVSARVIADYRIKAVTITGSVQAGRAVAEIAGSEVKKCVLELGGSDPAIILEDADLLHAARVSAFSRLINAGQNCIASKRFIVVESVYNEFIKLLVKEMTSMRMGNPLDEETSLGPLARYDLRDQLHHQVIESIAKGAEVLVGGEIPELQGAFYPSTVLCNCGYGMPVFDEETFGPVAAVCSVKDENEAVDVAGNSLFGLGASVFTRNPARGERIARELEAGACFVNAFVRSDPRLPFGGIGLSGFGRELSRNGMLEFMNCKTIYIDN
ncbi:MAG: NAD-dependent succinate-semialdehyde dehydrogenase [Candidatus Fermentibacteraceae bacterium]|nr:NAD-dependent succinate-semialdehyde dehydrogenase [Candidatus Fermentibacteraceae bacterium]